MSTELYSDKDTSDSDHSTGGFTPRTAPPRHDMSAAESQRPAWVVPVIAGVGGVALAVGGIGLYNMGKNSSNETANNGEGVVPPAENVAVAPVTPGQNENIPPAAEQPPTIEDIDIPREAREWVETNGHLYQPENLLAAYYTDKGHFETFGYSAIISQDFIDNYTESTNPSEGQLPSLRAQTLPLGLDITQSDNIIETLNGGVPAAIESYLNHKAINPSPEAQQIIEDEFAVTVGNWNDRENAQRLIATLDNILATNGSNAVYQVRSFEASNISSSSVSDVDPSVLEVNDDGSVAYRSITAYDSNQNPVAVETVVNPAIDITTFDSEGNADSKVFREQILFSLERDATNDYNFSDSVYIGEGTTIGGFN